MTGGTVCPSLRGLTVVLWDVRPLPPSLRFVYNPFHLYIRFHGKLLLVNSGTMKRGYSLSGQFPRTGVSVVVLDESHPDKEEVETEPDRVP